MRGSTIKRFDTPDAARTFDRGRFDLLELGGMTLGRARYEPGHDSWVVGEEPYVSLHLLGAGDYARKVDR